MKNKIVNQIDKIIWTHKLSPITLNLNATDNITEIQVFDIELKNDNLDDDVLKAIDKAIPFPIIFQLKTKEKVQVRTAYKRVSESDKNKWIVDTYFNSSWIYLDSKKEKLPITLNLEKLYEAIIKSFIPRDLTSSGTLKETIENHNKIEQLQKQYEQIKVKRSKEKQYNKQVELNSQLKSIKKQIEKLI